MGDFGLRSRFEQTIGKHRGQVVGLTMCCVLLFTVFVFFPRTASSQEGRDAEWFREEARTAIAKENFEYAIKTLREGIAEHPLVAELNLSLGDLYYKKKFYELALTEYLEADKKEPDDFSTLNQIQRCYGYLNHEDKSIDVLVRMLEKFPLDEHPSSYNTVDDLGWMYYKTHRLEEGEKLLLGALADRSRYDVNKGLNMTLGTIYSGMYDYEKSKKHYLAAIDEATDDGDTNFIAIAYYNLSLLEQNFFNYNSALLYTDEALANEERATGHLAKGELFQTRMDAEQTFSEYEQGLAYDETPLTMINLAVASRVFGRLDEAFAYAKKVVDSNDQTWMLNFGTDTDRHTKELYRILFEACAALARRETLLPPDGLAGGIVSAARSFWFGLVSYYYGQKSKMYSLDVGKAYLREKNFLDAYREFFVANEDYPHVALEYLDRAARMETALIPRSRALYLQEEGRVGRSKEKLAEALGLFDTFWEKQAIAETLIELVRLAGKNSVEGRGYLNRIYAINPGGLLQYGFGLPLELRFDLSGKMRIMSLIVPKLLRDAGSEIILENRTTNPADGFLYVLRVRWAEAGKPLFVLIDAETDKVVKQGEVEVGTGSPHALASRFIRGLLLDHVYSAGN